MIYVSESECTTHYTTVLAYSNIKMITIDLIVMVINIVN